DVAVAQRGAAHVDAHAVEHRLDRLFGERNVAQRIAGALQADHQAVADELIVARAAQRGDVLDADRRQALAGQRAKNQRQDQASHHPPLTRTVPSGWTAPDTVTPLSLLRTLMTSPAAPSCIAAPTVT